MLLVEDNTVDAAAIQRELGGRFEFRVAGGLGDAVSLLRQASWRPDVVLTDLALPDAEGMGVLQGLQAAAPGMPVLVSTGTATETLLRQLETLNVQARDDRTGGYNAARSPFLHHSVIPSLAAHRLEMSAEIERATRHATEDAVARAIDQFLDRLGLEDEEGLRTAVRLARGWEAAKSRFMSAMTTGIASALLLALGAGIVAMLRHGGSK